MKKLLLALVCVTGLGLFGCAANTGEEPDKETAATTSASGEALIKASGSSAPATGVVALPAHAVCKSGHATTSAGFSGCCPTTMALDCTAVGDISSCYCCSGTFCQ